LEEQLRNIKRAKELQRYMMQEYLKTNVISVFILDKLIRPAKSFIKDNSCCLKIIPYVLEKITTEYNIQYPLNVDRK